MKTRYNIINTVAIPKDLREDNVLAEAYAAGFILGKEDKEEAHSSKGSRLYSYQDSGKTPSRRDNGQMLKSKAFWRGYSASSDHYNKERVCKRKVNVTPYRWNAKGDNREPDTLELMLNMREDPSLIPQELWGNDDEVMGGQLT